MQIACKNSACNRQIEMNVPPTRGPKGMGFGNKGWLCLWCDIQVCDRCYVSHGVEQHPERYGQQAKNAKTKKR